MSDCVSVDRLFGIIRGLKQERSCLERKLQELKLKRENLERTVDAMKSKFNQASECNAKMKETQKVAHHKVNQNQCQTSKLEEQADAKRKYVDNLSTEIENERAEDFQKIIEFEAKIEMLCDKLVDMRKTNKENYVQNSIKDIEESLESNRNEREAAMKELDNSRKKLDEMKLEKELQELDMASAPVPVRDQRQALYVCQEEISAADQRLAVFPPRRLQLLHELQQLDKEHHFMEDKLGAIEQQLMEKLSVADNQPKSG